MRAVLEGTLRCILAAPYSHPGICIQPDAAPVDLGRVRTLEMDRCLQCPGVRVQMGDARLKASLKPQALSITSLMAVTETVLVHARPMAILSSRERHSRWQVTARLARVILKVIQAIRTIAVAHAFLEPAIVPAQSFESVKYLATLSHATPVGACKTQHIPTLHGLLGQLLKRV